MRRDYSHGYPLISMSLSILLLFPALSYGQAWSTILATSRAINWTGAGLPPILPDGETTTAPWIPPTRPACTSAQARTTIPIPSTASVATINSALASCGAANPAGSYLLLGSGTFNINSSTSGYAQNNVTLRGSGPQSTTLQLSGTTTYIYLGAASGAGSCPLTSASSNYTVGNTSFICTTASPPSVGQLIWINQCDTGFSGHPCTGTSSDNSGLYICSLQSVCDRSGGSGSSNMSEQQVFTVTSVTNSGGGNYTISVNTGLYMPNWAYAQTPYLNWQTQQGDVGIGNGLEDLTVFFSFDVDETIYMGSCYACWIKGVRLLGVPLNRALYIAGNTKNSLVANSYLFDIDPNPSNFNTSSGSQTTIQYKEDSDDLIINNIFQAGIFEGAGSSEGDIFAYNYLRDSQTNYYQNTEFIHNSSTAGSAFTLREGNEFGKTADDDTWGTHTLNTWFRNYISGWDPPYIIPGGGNPFCFEVDDFSRVENAVANVCGGPGISTYQVTNSATTYNYVWGFGTTTDTYALPTMLRWGNVSNVTQSSDTPPNSGVRFVSSEVPLSLGGKFSSFSNSVPANNNLPCSFFLAGYTSSTCTPHANGGTGLSWWKVCTAWSTFPTNCSTSETQPFPPIGPDVTSGPYVNGYAYDIPAQIAWKNLPVDPTYQHSYTITGSSWSGGTETLTISGLPSSNQHVMGGFQLSGVNSACNPNGGELLMIGSTTTTISYALTSNPGASCTGAMLFPDVRQFDEGVYQNDPSGQNGPPAPTGLQATVH